MATVEVRDAIHGLIPFKPQEWAVVNTAAFQRLRGVQQLALTHLVYPGARHSRFEHCMGASHVAGRLAERVRDASDPSLNVGRIRLAALVHDIGHGPFSHVSEEVFERLSGEEHVHEKISAAIVRHDRAVRGALGTDTATWIADLLGGTGHGERRTVARDIVAGPADIDKLDYLLRDSHYCGVSYGRYDLDKIVETSRALLDDTTGDTYLAYHEDGIYALEEMLLARLHMHRQVYGHKTRVGIDRMLVRSMLLGVEEGLLPKDIFCPPTRPNSAFVRDYLRFDDAHVTKTLCAAPETSAAGNVMRALVQRRLCKRVFQFEAPETREIFPGTLAGFVLKPDDKAMSETLADAETSIASAAGVEPYWATLYWDNRGDPLALRPSVRPEAKEIYLVDDTGQDSLFHDRSEVFGRQERATEPTVSLFLRTKADRPLSKAAMKRVRKTTLRELERIGRASARV
jgi:uncharacterized protein